MSISTRKLLHLRLQIKTKKRMRLFLQTNAGEKNAPFGAVFCHLSRVVLAGAIPQIRGTSDLFIYPLRAD